MSKESNDELLLVLAWQLPFATLFKTALSRAGKKREGLKFIYSEKAPKIWLSNVETKGQ